MRRAWPDAFVHYAKTWQGKGPVRHRLAVIDPERAVREIEDLNFRPESKQLMMRATRFASSSARLSTCVMAAAPTAFPLVRRRRSNTCLW